MEEQLATAIVAKMAGMELKKVDENTITQASTGPATKIDPKQFLPGMHQHQQNQQAAMLAQINQQAELLHPLPHQPAPTQALAPQPPAQPTQVNSSNDPNQLTFDFFDEQTTKKTFKQLDTIINYLYSINSKLDKILLKRD